VAPAPRGQGTPADRELRSTFDDQRGYRHVVHGTIGTAYGQGKPEVLYPGSSGPFVVPPPDVRTYREYLGLARKPSYWPLWVLRTIAGLPAVAMMIEPAIRGSVCLSLLYRTEADCLARKATRQSSLSESARNSAPGPYEPDGRIKLRGCHDTRLGSMDVWPYSGQREERPLTADPLPPMRSRRQP